MRRTTSPGTALAALASAVEVAADEPPAADRTAHEGSPATRPPGPEVTRDVRVTVDRHRGGACDGTAAPAARGARGSEPDPGGGG